MALKNIDRVKIIGFHEGKLLRIIDTKLNIIGNVDKNITPSNITSCKSPYIKEENNMFTLCDKSFDKEE